MWMVLVELRICRRNIIAFQFELVFEERAKEIRTLKYVIDDIGNQVEKYEMCQMCLEIDVSNLRRNS